MRFGLFSKLKNYGRIGWEIIQIMGYELRVVWREEVGGTMPSGYIGSRYLSHGMCHTVGPGKSL